MVDEDRLEEWVQEKLDAGVDRERIKKSLENTGHDPSLVEKVSSPFDSEPEGEKDVFQGEDDSSTVDADESDPVESGSAAVSENEEGDSSRSLSIPGFSVPSLPVLPAVVMLVIVAGLGTYLFAPSADDLDLPGVSSVPDIDVPEVDLPGLPDIGLDGISSTVEGAVSGQGCPDVGVTIRDVYTDNGETVAEVMVTRKVAEVILEVYDSGEMVGSATGEFGGTGTLTVSATGDEVVFSPVDCPGEPEDTERIS